jgi:hypothetical protein
MPARAQAIIHEILMHLMSLREKAIKLKIEKNWRRFKNERNGSKGFFKVIGYWLGGIHLSEF